MNIEIETNPCFKPLKTESILGWSTERLQLKPVRKLRRFDLNFITGRNFWELIFFITLPGRRHWQRMQSLREGIPAERFAHCPLHQGPAFEDHDHILAGVLGLVRQLRPRAGGRRVRRVHGHEQAHPDEEVLRDGLRLPGEIPSQLFLVKVARITGSCCFSS